MAPVKISAKLTFYWKTNWEKSLPEKGKRGEKFRKNQLVFILQILTEKISHCKKIGKNPPSLRGNSVFILKIQRERIPVQGKNPPPGLFTLAALRYAAAMGYHRGIFWGGYPREEDVRSLRRHGNGRPGYEGPAVPTGDDNTGHRQNHRSLPRNITTGNLFCCHQRPAIAPTESRQK